MKNSVKLLAGVALIGTLAACVETGGPSSGAAGGNSDRAACLSAVNQRAASSSNTILSYETSEANNLAMILDEYGVTWRCLVNGGSVVELNPV